MKLTLAIAVFNEEKNIHYALDSTIDWVDEVVAVDGGSTDKTIEILKGYGEKVRIIQADNPPMFHINKQKAIDAATGDWILQLDADEEITAELKEEICRLTGVGYLVSEKKQYEKVEEGKVDDGMIFISIDRSEDVRNQVKVSYNGESVEKEAFNNVSDNGKLITDNYFAYQIPRKNFFLGRPLMKGGVYPDYTIRLYKKGTVYFPCKDVHENVVPIENKVVGGRVQGVGENKNWLGTIENPMNHYSDPSFDRYLKRWKRYTTAEAKRVIEEARKLYNGNTQKLRLWRAIFVTKCFFFLAPYWFVKTYLRHKGFQDGWQGFVFHLMSAIRWWGIGYKVLSAKY
ncbi:MAG: glycosyltransferase family 2 protein [Patescibacteria group bacterium]